MALVVIAEAPLVCEAGDTDLLVLEARAGRSEAFKRLYEEYSSRIYNMVFRSVRNAQDAEDLCQEIWIKANRELVALRKPSAFSTWLYRIAARQCIASARTRACTPVPRELDDDVTGRSQDGPEGTAIQRETGRLTWEALASIPVRQQIALYLKVVEGRNYKEMAGILGISHSAVETLIFRARRGFTDAYHRLETFRGERCDSARKIMAALADGEGSPVQRRALTAHLGGCLACREEAFRARKAMAAYSALPLLPAPALLLNRLLEVVGPAALEAGVGGGATGLSMAGKAVWLTLAAKAKISLITLTAVSGLAVATVSIPQSPISFDFDGDSPHEISFQAVQNAEVAVEWAEAPHANIIQETSSTALIDVVPSAVALSFQSLVEEWADLRYALAQIMPSFELDAGVDIALDYLKKEYNVTAEAVVAGQFSVGDLLPALPLNPSYDNLEIDSRLDSVSPAEIAEIIDIQSVSTGLNALPVDASDVKTSYEGALPDPMSIVDAAEAVDPMRLPPLLLKER